MNSLRTAAFGVCRYRCCRTVEVRHLSAGVSALGGSVGGFSTRLFALLQETQMGWQRDNLACSMETLSSARTALVTATGLSSEGVAPEAVAEKLRGHYWSLDNWEDREAFFSVLAAHLSVDHDRIADRAEQLVALHSKQRNQVVILKSEAGLRVSLNPFYYDLFNVIARLEGGIKFLVDMRGDLLAITKRLHESGSSSYLLAEMGQHLKGILGQWFTPQLLEVCPITWQSPCDLLEKVSSYEAVHPLRHWKDLKHRLGANRRCFAFMHRAIPNEPIVILHAALTEEPANCIHTLLDRTVHQNMDNVSTANFYSISATQPGLSGVELGNFLIRRVVRELQREFPQRLTRFVTLSPIPGFKKWLDTRIKLGGGEQGDFGIPLQELDSLLPFYPESATPIHALTQALQDSSLWTNKERAQLAQALQSPLSRLCARYLAVVKRRGHAIDTVAHFHLQNGASIWRLNWMGDVSPKGIQRSYGLMVNYHYKLPDISKNSDQYSISGRIALSESVQQWTE